MHKVAPQVEAAVTIPLMHIVDAVASHLKQNSVHNVGLLGTRFTMQQPFYKERTEQNNVQVLVPEEEDSVTVDSIILKSFVTVSLLKSPRALPSHY